jgi:hypothetical protein
MHIPGYDIGPYPNLDSFLSKLKDNGFKIVEKGPQAKKKVLSDDSLELLRFIEKSFAKTVREDQKSALLAS